jgi:hypothetical protein
MAKTAKLSTIFKTMPNFRNYLTEKERNDFMVKDEGFIDDLQNWRESSLSLLRGAKHDLEDILNCDLMKQVTKMFPSANERWLGQLAIVLELLDEVEKEA